MFPSLAQRDCATEQMDQPDCCEIKLLRTVRQFTSINRLVSRYRTILQRWVLNDMMGNRFRTYHFVDLGAGGCDIDAWLLKEASHRGLNLRITACDMDKRICNYAESNYAGTTGLTVRHMDVLKSLPDEPIDYVFANHFLHHLSNVEIQTLLRQWIPLVNRCMIFSDLYRGYLAYAGYSILSLFYVNSFAREDGLISIRKGFLPGELVKLARSVGSDLDIAVHQLLPGRLILRIGCIRSGEKLESVGAIQRRDQKADECNLNLFA